MPARSGRPQPAAAGRGDNALLLSDKVEAVFLHWALGWLRADLTNNAQLTEQSNPAVKQFIRQ
jgi:hypothetical protein